MYALKRNVLLFYASLLELNITIYSIYCIYSNFIKKIILEIFLNKLPIYLQML
jgi:hypothetical protein